ncbi:hypothetical protein TOPH_02448 [Tolypocladium ophioglossoides CBS 100239]|uniref:Uncharacterized protein n=1 Tax=Tolypocladium ophioglossoides (strain CBS 100239) TaxID=1163406 RepID=A0A0L0NFV8_TOLOC|nr:hypothetical protein TOPH_02448 [Tolypocladium ophioglossoides CBS 100239]
MNFVFALMTPASTTQPPNPIIPSLLGGQNRMPGKLPTRAVPLVTPTILDCPHSTILCRHDSQIDVDTSLASRLEASQTQPLNRGSDKDEVLILVNFERLDWVVRGGWKREQFED